MISFKSHSGIYTLCSQQELSITLEEAWIFFSNPNNLQKITPKDMDFRITSNNEQNAYIGQIITYKIGILPMIKSNWVTEITQVVDNSHFIDEQRFGPYKMWHHEHFFEYLPNGNVLMKDKISYKLPFGFLGKWMHYLFIKNKLKQIFTYRFDILKNYFNG